MSGSLRGLRQWIRSCCRESQGVIRYVMDGATTSSLAAGDFSTSFNKPNNFKLAITFKFCPAPRRQVQPMVSSFYNFINLSKVYMNMKNMPNVKNNLLF